MDALTAIAAAPPAFRAETVADAVAGQFGLQGELHPLVSERDQNFRLEAGDQGRFLVKVSSALESAATTALQVDVLLHLAPCPEIIAPHVIRTLTGRTCGHVDDGETRLGLRVLSWVEGRQLETVGVDAGMAARFGAALGQLDVALACFDYAGENPVLLWDLQRLGELRPLLRHVDDDALRAAVATAIDDYEIRVAPLQADLPRQVIHADANPENVLTAGDRIGFIDFSDIVTAPRVFDVAIAASYLRSGGSDPLALVRPFVAAWQSVTPLGEIETGVLFDLVRARLATSITLLYWRLADRPAGDAYRQKSLQTEGTASHFLNLLNELGRKKFTNEIISVGVK
jgi:Ser/Thr protein kinase RdoA (MazF antagonist)